MLTTASENRSVGGSTPPLGTTRRILSQLQIVISGPHCEGRLFVRPRFSQAKEGALLSCPRLGAQSRRGGWSLDEVADAEISHMRDSFGTVVVTEFGSGFLAGVHSGDSSAAGVMGRPLGDVINFS